MASTMNRVLADADISISRGTHPNGCDKWVVTGISDDMISFKSNANTRITIDLRYPEDSMKPVFEGTKITSDDTRMQIERSQSFIDVWNALLQHME